jgi:hypothetical protein
MFGTSKYFTFLFLGVSYYQVEMVWWILFYPFNLSKSILLLFFKRKIGKMISWAGLSGPNRSRFGCGQIPTVTHLSHSLVSLLFSCLLPYAMSPPPLAAPATAGRIRRNCFPIHICLGILPRLPAAATPLLRLSCTQG